jgi:hypothetical protein
MPLGGGIHRISSEFLTSICKVFGSEAGTRAADLGIQMMGGYGYLTEYGMAQIWRDARICAIYEGTNGIHAKGLATRGLKPGGVADAYENFVIRISGGPVSDHHLQNWRNLKHALQASVDPSFSARAFYDASADLFQDAVWRRIRTEANHNPNPGHIKALAARVLGAS